MAAIPATHPTLSIDRDEPTMLHQHTLDQLRGLRLDGMIAALNDTATQAAAEALPFEQRLAQSITTLSDESWPRAGKVVLAYST